MINSTLMLVVTHTVGIVMALLHLYFLGNVELMSYYYGQAAFNVFFSTKSLAKIKLGCK